MNLPTGPRTGVRTSGKDVLQYTQVNAWMPKTGTYGVGTHQPVQIAEGDPVQVVKEIRLKTDKDIIIHQTAGDQGYPLAEGVLFVLPVHSGDAQLFVEVLEADTQINCMVLGFNVVNA